MSVLQDTLLQYELTTPMGEVESTWTLTYQSRPFEVTRFHDPHGRMDTRYIITALDTHRAIQPTSKRGMGIIDMLPTVEPAAPAEPAEDEDEDEVDALAVPELLDEADRILKKARPRYFHTTVDVQDGEVHTLCGTMIPKRTAVYGARAHANRVHCPACVSMEQHHADMERERKTMRLAQFLLEELEERDR